MYSELMARSVRCIEQQHDHELTVLTLWEKLKVMAVKEHFVMPETIIDFECLLDGDKRFRLREVKRDDNGYDEFEMEEEEFLPASDVIEGLGFDREQCVTLAHYQTEDDMDEDETFVPRLFEKNGDHTENPPVPRTKKVRAGSEKKSTRTTAATKRK